MLTQTLNRPANINVDKRIFVLSETKMKGSANYLRFLVLYFKFIYLLFFFAGGQLLSSFKSPNFWVFHKNNVFA
jgi:hypothetical protein